MTGNPDKHRESISHARALVMLVATAAGLILCFRMAAPFLSALTWALTLSVLFAPFQVWLEKRLKHPNAAALLSVLTIGVMVAVPVVFVGQHLILEAARGAQSLQSKLDSGEWQRFLESSPGLKSAWDRLGMDYDLPGTIRSAAASLSAAAGALLKDSLVQAMQFCLVFYLLFFMLRDRHAGLAALRAVSPLSSQEMTRLLTRVGDTIHATVYGTLAVAALQGLLGGLMFQFLGLPAPLLWGIVMMLLAIVPVLGAFVIWVPAAVFLALSGHVGKAVILTVWGTFVVGTADNLLRPVVVGNRLKLHTVLVFISVIGGLVVFGTSGLILGPLICTVTIQLLELWPHRTPGPPTMISLPEEVARFENEGGHVLLEPAVTTPSSRPD